MIGGTRSISIGVVHVCLVVRVVMCICACVCVCVCVRTHDSTEGLGYSQSSAVRDLGSGRVLKRMRRTRGGGGLNRSSRSIPYSTNADTHRETRTRAPCNTPQIIMQHTRAHTRTHTPGVLSLIHI